MRPDGTGLEWLAGGGFDNPVELIFTPAGETIGTMTYFQDPANGQRDALLHFVEGGVYPKWYSVVSEFKQTGDLMPVMTKFARIAPAGLARYRGAAFGAEYQGNLFSAQFNPHRVQRHVLHREGATFRTEDSDFLTSRDPDFHPTDVIEDADGSLLVLDTGAWFIHGCPISRVAKPEIKGSIYRIRRTGAARLPIRAASGLISRRCRCPRSRSCSAMRGRRCGIARSSTWWSKATRPCRRWLPFERTAPSYETRAAAVFALFRIGTAAALAEVRAALDDTDFRVRLAAARCAGMAGDRDAVERLIGDGAAGPSGGPAAGDCRARTDRRSRRYAGAARGRGGPRGPVCRALRDLFIDHAAPARTGCAGARRSAVQSAQGGADCARPDGWLAASERPTGPAAARPGERSRARPRSGWRRIIRSGRTSC